MAKKPSKAAAKSPAKKSKKTTSPAEVAPPSGDRTHVCIRKISNGYVVSQSGYRRGKHYEREVFTPKQPKLSVSPARNVKGSDL